MSETLPNPEAAEDIEPKPETLTKTIFVKRSNGEVSTMRIAEDAKVNETGRLRAYIIENDEENGEEYIAGYKPISERALSDDVQAALAAEYTAKNPIEQKAEKEPLSDAEEDVAELAIEVSTGIEDPSEVDENARMFDPAELRAMREASQRATHFEAPHVNPYDAFLDPNTPDVVEKETRPDVYAYLKEALPPVTRGDTEASQKYYDKFVTEENKQVSLEFLGEAVKADREIARILNEAGLKPTDMAAVDAIRENPDVRYNVAKRLTQKLDTLADENPEDFGWRVADNSPNNLKVDPQTGKRMKSRMYAVDMALKMLGGEFSERNEAKDFERDSNDRVAIGQHRHAARTTIMSWHA